MPNTREKLSDLVRDALNSVSWDWGDYPDVDEVADHLIANGVTVQKWIPVTEMLPEEDGRYLCNTRSFAFPGSFYQTIMKYDKGGFIEGYIYTDDVIHWMPLPQAPKGE